MKPWLPYVPLLLCGTLTEEQPFPPLPHTLSLLDPQVFPCLVGVSETNLNVEIHFLEASLVMKFKFGEWGKNTGGYFKPLAEKATVSNPGTVPQSTLSFCGCDPDS